MSEFEITTMSEKGQLAMPRILREKTEIKADTKIRERHNGTCGEVVIAVDKHKIPHYGKTPDMKHMIFPKHENGTSVESYILLFTLSLVMANIRAGLGRETGRQSYSVTLSGLLSMMISYRSG